MTGARRYLPWLALIALAQPAHAADPAITAVSRDLTPDYAWGFSSGVKQQHGSYLNGRSLHAVLQRSGTTGENGYPDYLVWFNEHTGQTIAMTRAVAYPTVGKNPATQAVFTSDAPAGETGRIWWVMGGRANLQPFDLYRSVHRFQPLVLEQMLDNFVTETQSTTPALAVVGETGLLPYRWRASGNRTGEIRFRNYGLTTAGSPVLRFERSLGRASTGTAFGDITIEQLWSRWDPRWRAFALTWQWFQHTAATPDGKAFGSNPFLVTRDFGTTWQAADGTTVALPLTYASATASAVITPYEHFGRGESTGWLPRDIGFTPGGAPWITLVTGPISGRDSGWSLTFFRWDGVSWQATVLADDMEANADAMSCGPVRDFLVCAYSQLGTPGELLVKVSRDDGVSWSTPVSVNNVGIAESGAVQRINWVSFAQPSDRYLDNTARFFVGYYRVGETEGREYKNRLRWVRVQVGPRADFNGDGLVDDADLAEFTAAHSLAESRTDFNDDGVVDALDQDAFVLSMAGVDPELPPEPPPPDPPDPPDPGPGVAFQQDADGLVSMEGENSEPQPIGWAGVALTGTSGGQVIKAASGAATPNSDRSRYAEYRVNFTRSGTHNVWLRMRGFAGSQYRLRLGLDSGSPVVRSTSTDGVWRWKKLGTAIQVPSVGTHVIRVYRKDPNVELDKIVLTPGTYQPTGLGPAESPRG